MTDGSRAAVYFLHGSTANDARMGESILSSVGPSPDASASSCRKELPDPCNALKRGLD
jgi:hypothetical protein